MREKSVVKTDMLCPKIRTVFSFNLKNSPQNEEETIDVSELFLKHTLSFSTVKTTSIKTGGQPSFKNIKCFDSRFCQ